MYGIEREYNAISIPGYYEHFLGQPTYGIDPDTGETNYGVVTTDRSGWSSSVPVVTHSYFYDGATSGVTKAQSSYGQLSHLPGKLVVQLMENVGVRAILNFNNNYQVSGVERQVEVADSNLLTTIVDKNDIIRDVINPGVDVTEGDA